LFRSRKTPSANEEQEIVVSLTPTIMRQRPVNNVTVEQQKQSGNVVNVAYYNPGKVHYSGIPKEMAQYVNDVQRKISQAIVYPPEAESNSWEGTVKLGLLILHDGTLAYASVRESSGYDVFDQHAVKTAREVSEYYGTFPSDTNLQELEITLPIVYSLGQR
jgi:TonB family protein